MNKKFTIPVFIAILFLFAFSNFVFSAIESVSYDFKDSSGNVKTEFCKGQSYSFSITSAPQSRVYIHRSSSFHGNFSDLDFGLTPQSGSGTFDNIDTINDTVHFEKDGNHLWKFLSKTITIRDCTPTATISANPTTVASGGSATVTWSSTDATSCTVKKNGVNWASGVSGSQNSGTLTVNPTIFEISCSGNYGTSSPKSVNVTVTSLPDVSCLPLSQTVNAGFEKANLTASGGDGNYSWSAPGAETFSGNLSATTGSSFWVQYPNDTSSGIKTKTVTVSSAGKSKSCTVDVRPNPYISSIYIDPYLWLPAPRYENCSGDLCLTGIWAINHWADVILNGNDEKVVDGSDLKARYEVKPKIGGGGTSVCYAQGKWIHDYFGDFYEGTAGHDLYCRYSRGTAHEDIGTLEATYYPFLGYWTIVDKKLNFKEVSNYYNSGAAVTTKFTYPIGAEAILKSSSGNQRVITVKGSNYHPYSHLGNIVKSQLDRDLLDYYYRFIDNGNVGAWSSAFSTNSRAYSPDKFSMDHTFNCQNNRKIEFQVKNRYDHRPSKQSISNQIDLSCGGGNIPAVSADIKANGSQGPVSISNGSSANLTWTSSGGTGISCSASGAWSGVKSANNTTGESTGSLSGPASYIYSLNCTNSEGGSGSDSVTVTVGSATGFLRGKTLKDDNGNQTEDSGEKWIRDTSGPACPTNEIVQSGVTISYSGPANGTTVSNQCSTSSGNPIFNVSGLPAGTYTVTVSPPSGWQVVGSNSRTVNISAGGAGEPIPVFYVKQTSVAANDAVCESVGAPDLVVPGQSFTSTVQMKNSGTKEWTNNAVDPSTPHRLGSQNPQDNSRWGLGRVDLPSSVISPNQSAVFNFNATAPSIEGTYPFDWKMVEDGVQWFGATCQKNIRVVKTPTTSTFCSGATSKVTISWSEAGMGSSGYWMDVDNDNNWGNGFWHKEMPVGTLSTIAPDGFSNYGGSTGPLVLNGGASYQVRVLYKQTSLHSSISTFTAQSCTGSLVGKTLKDDNGNQTEDSGEKWIRDTSGPACPTNEIVQSGVTISYSGPANGTTVSNQCSTSSGNPIFNVSGLPAGTYTVTVSPPSGWQVVGSNSRTVNISAGGAGEPIPVFYVNKQTLLATLTANPTSGNSPLQVNFTANISGTATGTINYTFWKNCSYAGSSVSESISQCGNPDKKIDNSNNTSENWNITYPQIGTNSAKIIVERGAVTPAQSSQTINIINNKPATSNVKVTEPNFCFSGPAATIDWTFADSDNDPQSAYQVQVDDQGSFQSPEHDTGKVSCVECRSNNTGPGKLTFNKTYKARVKAWDSNNLESDWTEMSILCNSQGSCNSASSWKTPKHTYPTTAVDIFTHTPTEPAANEDIQFTDKTKCFDDNNSQVACDLWSWTFGDGGSSALQNPKHTYLNIGTFTVTEVVKDRDNLSCQGSKVLNITEKVPIFKEVSPKK